MGFILQSSPLAAAVTFVLILQVLGCFVGVQCTTNDTGQYDDCTTNFATLESALIHTPNNTYKLWTEFYPPREAMAIFVHVKYQIINSTSSIEYIWTSAAFNLIHPPRVFGMTSLFFGFIQESRIGNVTLQLPENCEGLLTSPNYERSDAAAKNDFLEVLTQRLRLYAKFRSNGSTVVIPDKFEGKAILSTPNAILEIYHNTSKTGTLFSLLLGIPVLLCPFMIIYMKGARRQIRFYLRNPNHHASLAALTSISLIFSVFVVAMDIAAVFFAYTNNELTMYAKFDTTFSFIPVVLVIDLVALVLASVILIALVCKFCQSFPCTCYSYQTSTTAPTSNSCKCIDATDCCFSCFLSAIFCFRKLKSSGNDDRRNEQQVWLLTIVFVAPFIAFGTHFTYIVIAWIQYPDHAGAISIMYILTFLYLFITFRFLYLCLSDNKNAYSTYCKCAKGGDIESPAVEAAQYEDSERNNFQPGKVLLITAIGIAVCGIEVWLIAGLVTLPIAEVIEDAPTYIYAWFRTIFVIVTGLITYKLLTFQRPDNTTFLVTLLKASKYLYSQDQTDIPSVVSDVEKAAVVLSVIMKQRGHPIPTDGQSKSKQLWDKTFP